MNGGIASPLSDCTLQQVRCQELTRRLPWTEEEKGGGRREEMWPLMQRSKEPRMDDREQEGGRDWARGAKGGKHKFFAFLLSDGQEDVDMDLPVGIEKGGDPESLRGA
jgi:hypothetical protein